jgi:hypothetical protein
VSVAAILIEPAAPHGGFRCAYLEVQTFILDIPLHPISSEQQSSWNNVPLSTLGQKKGPGEVVAGASSPASH